VVIDQNAIHKNESSKPERKERRRVVASGLLEDHFRKEWLETKQTRISGKGSKDKVDNVTQKLEGVEDGKTQFGQMRVADHTLDLNTELTFWFLDEFLFVSWTEKLKALKKQEQQRDPADGGKKYFFAQSQAFFVIAKL
jgi:hypothetical protein